MKRAIQNGASTGNAETDATVQKWKLQGKLMRAVPFAKGKRKALKGAGDWPQGKQCDSYIDHSAGSPMSSAAMIRWASSNSSLLAYLYPQKKPETVEEGWQALLPGCRVVPSGCWCFHVAGSMVKADNPRGAERCVPKDTLMNCMDPAAGAFHMMSRRNCSCFAQRPAAPPCLFGDMRPAKLLAIISACRAAGVTHIIEQGRYGGLSAYMYALHGFKVTSVELLPLVEVSAAMRTLAPQLTMVDADGRASVIKLVNAAPKDEKLAVIFDGEKRHTAYETYLSVKQRVSLAAFDDSNLDLGDFPKMLQTRGEAAWHTWDCAFMREHDDSRPLRFLEKELISAGKELLAKELSTGGAGNAVQKLRRQRQIDEHGRLMFHGGMVRRQARNPCDLIQPRPYFDWLLGSLLTARRLDSCLGRRTSRVFTRRLCEAGSHGSLRDPHLGSKARLPCLQACAARWYLLCSSFHSSIPRLQLYAQGQPSKGRVGRWGVLLYLRPASAV